MKSGHREVTMDKQHATKENQSYFQWQQWQSVFCALKKKWKECKRQHDSQTTNTATAELSATVYGCACVGKTAFIYFARLSVKHVLLQIRFHSFRVELWKQDETKPRV